MLVSNSRAAFARMARLATTATGTTSPTLSVVSLPANRGFVSATNALLEKHITKVPTMGDSISEGTIVEWMAQVGQRVEEEDVVALIETDKVTVDIKATKAGVISQQFGAIDDEVEVGADLYEIDTEAEATVDAAEAATQPAQSISSVNAPTTEPTPTEIAAPAATTAEAPPRVPSIKFLGKDGWKLALIAEPELVIPASYGRHAFSEEEIEALLSGGANLAPGIDEYSQGATFSA